MAPIPPRLNKKDKNSAQLEKEINLLKLTNKELAESIKKSSKKATNQSIEWVQEQDYATENYVSFGSAGTDYIPITIGSTTNNVLTSHQSLNGYATESWVTDKGYLTSVSWDDVGTKPDTATRWPSWSEVTSKPTSKTAWGQTYLNASSEFQNISGNMSSVGHIGFIGDDSYDLGTSSVRMRSGYFGTSLLVNAVEIGHTNEINGTGNNTLYLQYRNSGNLSLCYNGANVGIGLTSPSYKLHVNGKIYCTGGFAFLSDIRKKNVVGFCNGFSVKDIANAPLIQYTLKEDLDDGRRHIGSVAQYWQKVLPDTVNEVDDTLSMDQESILMASVITLARKVMSLENQIIQLKVKGYGK